MNPAGHPINLADSPRAYKSAGRLALRGSLTFGSQIPVQICLPEVGRIAMLATFHGRGVRKPSARQFRRQKKLFAGLVDDLLQKCKLSPLSPDIVCPKGRYTIYRVSFGRLAPHYG